MCHPARNILPHGSETIQKFSTRAGESVLDAVTNPAAWRSEEVS
jgi:hypothetical protein